MWLPRQPVLNIRLSSIYQGVLDNNSAPRRAGIYVRCLIPCCRQTYPLTTIPISTNNMVDILAKGKACLPCRARKSVCGFHHHLPVLTLCVFTFRNVTVLDHRAAGAARISVPASIERNLRRWTFSRLKLLVSPIGCASSRCEGSSLPLRL